MKNKKKYIIIGLVLIIAIVVFIMVISNHKKSVAQDKASALVGKNIEKVQSISNFVDGLAAVRIDDKYGYINQQGKIVIAPQYSYATMFNDGFARVCNTKGKKYICGFIDKNNQVIIDLKYNYGQEDSTYDKIIYSIPEVEDGYILVQDGNKKAIFNTSGKVLLSFAKKGTYEEFTLTEDGKIITTTKDGTKWSIIDANNNFQKITKEEYGFSLGCTNGFCEVEKGTKSDSSSNYGYIDYNGNLVIPCKFKTSTQFNKNGVAAVSLGDNQLGLINKQGKFIVKPIYKDLELNYYTDEGFLLEDEDSNIVAFNENGKKLFTLNSDYEMTPSLLKDNNSFSNGYAVIIKEDEYYYVNKKGEIKIGPYTKGRSFSDGLAFVQENDKNFFFINVNGEKVIKGKFA